MSSTKSCLNCGRKYQVSDTTAFFDVDYCSKECFTEDEQRLAEGNKVIASAAANESLSNLNKVKLDVQGPIGLALGNMVHFGRSDTLASKNVQVDNVVQPVEDEKE